MRHGGTLFALSRLHDKDLLSASEYARLASAYQFLRHLEHRLQFDDDRQTHTLPTNPEELEVIARKMPPESGAEFSAESLEVRLEQHLTNVRELYGRVIQAQKPIYYTPVEGPPAPPWLSPEAELGSPAPSNLTRYLDERAPQLAATLARLTLHRGRERFEHFLEKVFSNPEWLRRLDADAALVERVVDIFEHSQYFGDQLLRHPEMLDELEPANRRPDGSYRGQRVAAEPLPPEDAADPERQHSGAGADLRNAGENLGSGRSGDRGGLPHRIAGGARVSPSGPC